MSNQEQLSSNPSKKLSRAYIIALGVIALLTISGQLLIRYALADQTADSGIINIAGRQRMLSQKVTKLSLQLVNATTAKEVAVYKKRLVEAKALWESSHQALQEGNEALGIPKGYNSEIIQEYFETIAPHYEAMKQGLDALLNYEADASKTAFTSALKQISTHESSFLKIMNTITFQYADEAKEKIDFLKTIELVLLILTLVVLLFEVFYIFQPAIRKLDASFKIIERKTKDLSAANGELAEKNDLVQEYLDQVSAQNEELQQQSEELVTSNENLKETQSELEENIQDKETLNEELLQNTEELMQINEKLEESHYKLTDALAETKEKETILQKQKDVLEQAMSELKETQMQLVQSEKLSSIGQLTAGVAHEINNPVNFIYAGASTLQQTLNDLNLLLGKYTEIDASLSHEKLVTKLQDIEHYKKQIFFEDLNDDVTGLMSDILLGAERTRDIVKSLRTFTRLDENTVKEVDLHENIDSTLIILNGELKDRVEVIKNYDGTLPKIDCHIGQLNQVFLNLINNGSQAIEGEGTLTITTKFLPTTDQVAISISDTGKGIKEASMSKIFDPFYTTKPVGEGTGLGLSICRKIIDKHDGKIEVRSEVGKGTTFMITLPILQEDTKGMVD